MQKKIALVTGGSRGIGEAIVRKLITQDYFVYFTYSASHAAAENLVTELNTNEHVVEKIKVTFPDEEEQRKAIDYIAKQSGHLDLLVNNAGIIKDALMPRMDFNEWDEVIDINLKSVFRLSKLALDLMFSTKQGCIVNMTSVSGIRGAVGQCNYAAAKGGIIALTKSMARELSPFNIRVNAVAPGFIESDMTKNIAGVEKKKVLQTCLLKRFGKPNEIANVVAFLASDSASYIQGQVIVVDGGVIL